MFANVIVLMHFCDKNTHTHIYIYNANPSTVYITNDYIS